MQIQFCWTTTKDFLWFTIAQTWALQTEILIHKETIGEKSNITLTKTAANIGLAIVGRTVANSTSVLLLGFCAKAGLTFFKCPTIAKP